MNIQNDELGNRHQHRWSGLDRDKDIAALADKLAEVVDNLFNHDGALVQLDPTGKLLPVNRAALHDIITKHIAAVRVVNRDGVWRKEFFSYAFAPKPRFGPPTVANPRADKDTGHEPDLEVLDQLFRHELLWRVPKQDFIDWTTDASGMRRQLSPAPDIAPDRLW